MTIIISSSIFSNYKELFLYNFLNPSMIPGTPQKVSRRFTDREGNYHSHYALNYLNLVKEKNQTCKVDIDK